MNQPDGKLAFALLVQIAATGLLLIGRLTGEEWVTTTTWVTAAYMLGQAAGVYASGFSVYRQQFRATIDDNHSRK